MSTRVHNRVTDDQRELPCGAAVIVTRDDGSELQTTTRSVPFQCADGMSNAGLWVVFVKGIAGYYALCRVRPVAP